MGVLDASVLVKLVTEEPGSSEAEALLAREPALSTPQLAMLEVAGARSKKVRYHQLPMTRAVQALAALAAFGLEIVPDSGLVARAMEISVEMKHAIQDCVYLALAEGLGCPLVTADQKFVGKQPSYSGPATIELLA